MPLPIPPIATYHNIYPEELAPPAEPDRELLKRRRIANVLGSLGGLGLGLSTGIGRTLYKDKQITRAKLPYILAVTLAGYGVGAAGARFYNSWRNPYPNEHWTPWQRPPAENPAAEPEKTAAALHLEGLAISPRHKLLLQRSRDYLRANKQITNEQTAAKKELELMSLMQGLQPKTPAKAKSAMPGL